MNEQARDLEVMPLQYVTGYAAEDEISLVDLWITLARFKKVFLVSLSLLVAIGLVLVALLLAEKYSMSSIIEPGRIMQGDTRVPVETPTALVNRLNTSILPEVTRQYADKHGLPLFKTSVANPKGTNLVIIKNTVDENSRSVIADFQREVVSRITGEHQKQGVLAAKVLQQQLAQERKLLSELTNPLKLVNLTETRRLTLASKRQQLAVLTDKTSQQLNRQAILDRIELVEDDILAYSEQIDALVEQMGAATGSNVGRSSIRADIAENRLAINELRETGITLRQRLARFNLDLEQQIAYKQAEIDLAETAISVIGDELNGEIVLQKAKIKALEQQLDADVSHTPALAELSLKPVGMSSMTAAMLVVVLSVIGAFMITMAAIFRQKVREKVAGGE